MNQPRLLPINPRYQMILNQIPKDDLNENERQVAVLIGRIPYGHIASYKAISEWAQHKYQYSSPLSTAKLRRKLYGLLGHHSGFPLWRLATDGDEDATNDSIPTRVLGMQERMHEGSWKSPVWFVPSLYDDQEL